jgi:uncharacterized membrane protein
MGAEASFGQAGREDRQVTVRYMVGAVTAVAVMSLVGVVFAYADIRQQVRYRGRHREWGKRRGE